MDIDEIREIAPLQEIEGRFSRIGKIKIDPSLSIMAHREDGLGKPMPHETHEETGDSLYLSDLRTQKDIRELNTTLWRIHDIAFNKDGSLLACAGKVVEVWDVKTLKRIITFENFNPAVKRVAFDPVDNFLICTSIVPLEKPPKPRPAYGITLLDINKGKAYDAPPTETEAAYEYQLISFEPHGKHVVGCSVDYPSSKTSKLRAWYYHKYWPFQNPRLKTIWTKEFYKIDSVTFHPDGREFFCVSLTRRGMIINQFETKSGKATEILRRNNPFLSFNSLNIHPNGKLLAIAGYAFRDEGGIWILDLETSKLHKISDSNSHYATFSPDGSYLLSVWQNKVQTFGVFPSNNENEI